MSAESDTATGFGIASRFGWPIGGALGGALGAAAFGALIWLIDPAVVEVAIPALYGLGPGEIVGWGIHLFHGAVLGIVFGFLVTRDVVLETLRTDVETDALAESGNWLRLVGAGFAYGLAVWAILPALVLPIWVGRAGVDAAAAFPAVAVDGMIGHAVFGLVLGLVFAATVDLQDR
ncbi:hypothetical protein ACFOZ7_06330 [Natribaculum luteum]|uniref:Histidine kinase n=1 Tax=Natribaculum luteum TaxID=1586232 RepID=A0ABD5NXE4_9EURY|nr:hypothetical protein [Natribaculum luteum]